MDDQIAQFVSITGLDSERAKFFVESAGGDVETALSTFYESEGAQDGEEADELMSEPEVAAPTPAPAPAPVVDTTGPRTLSGAPAPSAPTNWPTNTASSSSAKKPGAGYSSSGGPGRIGTLRDLQSGAQEGNDDDDDEDDDNDDDDSKGPANFYTGGERSGLNVQNPNRGNRGGDAPDVVRDIMKKALDNSREMAKGGSSSRGGASAATSTPSFTGRGRTINDPEPPPSSTQGQNEDGGRMLSSEYMRSLRQNAFGPPLMSSDDDNEDEGEVAMRTITFWQDGFTIADGPLCRYDDPQHAQTLAMINANRAPLDLLNVRFNQQVQLSIEKKLNEKYKPPPPGPMKAFTGSGNRLGAPVPSMTGDSSSSSTTTTTTTTTSVPVTQPAPATSVPGSSSMFQVDASQPTTQIQIRLGDGQRMVAKFNHTHTVADIRRYINASHPGMTSRDYILQSSFPPKPLTEEEQSLKDAGLINSVVIQKWA